MTPDGSGRRLRVVARAAEDAAALDPMAVIDDLYRAQAERLWRSVRAYAGDADVASDAVAEAFAQLIRRGDGVRDPAAWLWRTTFRIAAGDLKVRRDRSTEPPVDIVSTVSGSDVSLDLLRALAQLSPMQRAALLLHDYAGFPARDAARICGSTEAAVRVHVMRGRRRMRSLLDDEQDVD